MPASPLHRQLDEVQTRDRGRLIARLRALDQGKTEAGDPRRAALAADIEVSAAKSTARRALVPALTFDEALPVAREADRLIEAIAAHPVVIVAGETGSGKTTQLPKLCLAAGRGVRGLIGCTQPRRIAARAVARRVASELTTEVGGLVGFQVRFTEEVGENALIKFMTDGILLAEIQSDPWLSKYDTLIIDEAHERSLNIDFLLGYLKRLLERRRDLKVIVTSATIDTARFAQHFGGAPVIDVEGRGFPVEVRWRPPPRDQDDDEDERAGTAAILAAIDELTREDPLGDVLVFLPGEREIRDTHQALERRAYRSTEVLPLYARLSARDQDRVFNPGRGRRIVLATNVAETSLTVPRIRYVVDPGTARISRYSHRHKVQRLHIEAVSQASADQRRGRCGRVADGVCVRLYAEADYATRPSFTDPELLRSSLAGVILRMLSLRLGDPAAFPFLDAPLERAWADGYQQLVELGALDKTQRTLTPTGHELARWPIDVALARMVIESRKLEALPEVLVLAAFLSIPDPRERPAAARQAADAAHAFFADKRSDFIGVLNLWKEYQLAHAASTQSRLREWCAKHFVSFMRMREWRELHRQLLLVARESRWQVPDALTASYEAIHRALLSGLPTQVARKDERGEYRGTRGRRYVIFPGSALAKSPPLWLLSASLLDTGRLFALSNARVEPEWVEEQAGHLVQRRLFDPHWSRAAGRVLAFEQVTLFGLPLTERRRVNYANHDPVVAREIFLRDGLAGGEVDARAAFIAHNRAVLEAAVAEESKRRRHGLLREAEELAQWYAQRIPEHVLDAVGLDAWHRKLDPELRRGLLWSLGDVLASPATARDQFPEYWLLGSQRLPLTYRFEPGSDEDGVSVDVPLALLNALPATRADWLVPGLIEERVAELIRSLPKAVRRHVVPAPDFARAFLDTDAEEDRALTPQLAAFLAARSGVALEADAFDVASLPPHLRLRVRVLDEQHAVIAASRDLTALRAEFGARAQTAFATVMAQGHARSGLRRFEFERIPTSIVSDSGLVAYPALVDVGDGVDLRVFETAAQADTAHPQGIMRLLHIALDEQIKRGRRQLPLGAKVALAYTAIASPDALRADLVEAALRELALAPAAGIRTRPDFEALARQVGRELFAQAVLRLEPVEAALTAYAQVAPRLSPPIMGYGRASFDDLKAQLRALIRPGFAEALAVARLIAIARYVRAMGVRVDRLLLDARRDQEKMLRVLPFLAILDAWTREGYDSDVVDALRWQIEELRVAVFAPELGVAEGVSEKRTTRFIATHDPSRAGVAPEPAPVTEPGPGRVSEAMQARLAALANPAQRR